MPWSDYENLNTDLQIIDQALCGLLGPGGATPPDCPDENGQHLNFTAELGWTCGGTCCASTTTTSTSTSTSTSTVTTTSSTTTLATTTSSTTTTSTSSSSTTTTSTSTSTVTTTSSTTTTTNTLGFDGFQVENGLTFPASSSRYGTWGFAGSTVVSDAPIMVPSAGRIGVFQCAVATAPGSGNTWKMVVSVAGPYDLASFADSTLTCTIANTAVSCFDTLSGHYVTVQQGSLFTFRAQVTAGTPGTPVGRCSVSLF